MKNRLVCLCALILSLNAFAAVAAAPITSKPGYSLTAQPATDTMPGQSSPEAVSERQTHDAITEFRVYLLIILIYAIYGFRQESGAPSD